MKNKPLKTLLDGMSKERKERIKKMTDSLIKEMQGKRKNIFDNSCGYIVHSEGFRCNVPKPHCKD